jgi:hypothetical protein
MTNRNDLEVAHSRIESLERDKRALVEQNALLNARLQPQPKRGEPTRPTTPPPAVASPMETDADEESSAPWITTLLVAVLAIATTAIIMMTGQT